MRNIRKCHFVIEISIARVKIPTDPHMLLSTTHVTAIFRIICMQSRCDECKNHGLDRPDVESYSESSNSKFHKKENESEKTFKFQEWNRDDYGNMMKSHVILLLGDEVEL